MYNGKRSGACFKTSQTCDRNALKSDLTGAELVFGIPDQEDSGVEML
jgi:hypothetical protein